MYKEYFLELDKETVAYVYFRSEKGDVIEFVVKLLSIFEDRWHEVIRFDNGHGCPHKDILDINGGVIRKIWYDFLDNGQALTIAVTDLKDNFEFYNERYRKWLKGQ